MKKLTIAGLFAILLLVAGAIFIVSRLTAPEGAAPSVAVPVAQGPAGAQAPGSSVAGQGGGPSAVGAPPVVAPVPEPAPAQAPATSGTSGEVDTPYDGRSGPARAVAPSRPSPGSPSAARKAAIREQMRDRPAPAPPKE